MRTIIQKPNSKPFVSMSMETLEDIFKFVGESTMILNPFDDAVIAVFCHEGKQKMKKANLEFPYGDDATYKVYGDCVFSKWNDDLKCCVDLSDDEVGAIMFTLLRGEESNGD